MFYSLVLLLTVSWHCTIVIGQRFDSTSGDTSTPSAFPTVPSTDAPSVTSNALFINSPQGRDVSWPQGSEQVISWTSQGMLATLSQVNVALYKGPDKIMNLNQWSGVNVLSGPPSSSLRWVVYPSLPSGDDYHFRIERIGQSSSQFAADSDTFSITSSDMDGSDTDGNFEESSGRDMYFVTWIIASAMMTLFLAATMWVISQRDRAWKRNYWGFCCVFDECAIMVIILALWKTGLDDFSIYCHGFMMSAVSAGLIKLFAAFSLFFGLDENGSYLAKKVFCVCLTMDIVQTVLYTLTELNCGIGLTPIIVLSFGLLLIFIGKLGMFWELTRVP